MCEKGVVVQGGRSHTDLEGQTPACPGVCGQRGWNLRSQEVIARDKADGPATPRASRVCLGLWTFLVSRAVGVPNLCF